MYRNRMKLAKQYLKSIQQNFKSAAINNSNLSTF